MKKSAIFICLLLVSSPPARAETVVLDDRPYPVYFMDRDESRVKLEAWGGYPYPEDQMRGFNEVYHAYTKLPYSDNAYTHIYLNPAHGGKPYLEILSDQELVKNLDWPVALNKNRIALPSRQKEWEKSLNVYGKWFGKMDLFCNSVSARELNFCLKCMPDLKVLSLPFAPRFQFDDVQLPAGLEKLVLYNSVVSKKTVDRFERMSSLKELVLWGCNMEQDDWVGGILHKILPQKLSVQKITLINCDQNLIKCLSRYRYPELRVLEVSGFELAVAVQMSRNYHAFPKLEKYIYHALITRDHRGDQARQFTRQAFSTVKTMRLSDDVSITLSLHSFEHLIKP